MDISQLTNQFASQSWWYVPPPDPSEIKQVECKATLYPHQKKAVQWLNNTEKGGMLQLTMGLGKSLTSMYWALIEEKAPAVLLVVAKSLVSNWETMLVDFFPNLEYDILHKDYGNDPRTYTNSENKRLVITTYDVVLSMSSLHGIMITVYDVKLGFAKRNPKTLESKGVGSFLFKTEWGVIISDESQRFRNPESKLFYAMMGLTSKKYCCLSATPIQNRFDDLYTQLRFLDVDEVQQYQYFGADNFSKHDLYKHFLLMNYESAGITLPPLIREDICVDYTPLEQEANVVLHTMSFKSSNNEYTQDNVDGKKIPLWMIVRHRMSCLCMGLGLKGKSKSMFRSEVRKLFRDYNSVMWTRSTKFLTMAKIVKQVHDRGEKIILFSTYVSALKHFTKTLHDIYQISSILIEGSMDLNERQACVDTFKRSHVHPVFMCTFQMGSEGMNLVEACNIGLMDYWWNPSVIRQAIARAHRIGQTKPVKVYCVRMNKSIEHRLHEVAHSKEDLIDTFENGVLSQDTIATLLKFEQ